MSENQLQPAKEKQPKGRKLLYYLEKGLQFLKRMNKSGTRGNAIVAIFFMLLPGYFLMTESAMAAMWQDVLRWKLPFVVLTAFLCPYVTTIFTSVFLIHYDLTQPALEKLAAATKPYIAPFGIIGLIATMLILFLFPFSREERDKRGLKYISNLGLCLTVFYGLVIPFAVAVAPFLNE